MINSGDTGFMLFSALLSCLGVLGFACFYGGYGGRKNMGRLLTASIFAASISVIMWVLCGYSLSYVGNSAGGLLGTFSLSALKGIGFIKTSAYAKRVPEISFFLFEMIPALFIPVIAAATGRLRLKEVAIFTVLQNFLVVYPLTHMTQSPLGLLLSRAKTIDFAFGAGIGLAAGVSALIIFLTRREKDEPRETAADCLGAQLTAFSLIFLGLIGIAGGSALSANFLAAHSVLCALLSCFSAIFAQILFDVFTNNEPSAADALEAGVCGLISILSCAGFVPVWAAILVGLGAGIIGFFARGKIFTKLKDEQIARLFTVHGLSGLWGILAAGTVGFFARGKIFTKFKDEQIARIFTVHGLSGLWGILAAGIFASASVNSKSLPSLIARSPKQIMAQFLLAAAVIILAVIGTLLSTFLARLIGGIGVKEDAKEGGAKIKNP